MPYDILSEQTSVEEWLDDGYMWLRLRMIPKSYTFQNLIDEYEQSGMEEYITDAVEMVTDESDYSKWR